MNVLQNAKDRLLWLRLEIIEVEQFIALYHHFSEPQAATGLAPAQAAGRAHNPIPAATVSTAPVAIPSALGGAVPSGDDNGALQAKRVVEEPSESEGSAGVQDRCESTPAPVSALAEVPEAAASEHPEAHSMATGGKQDAGAVASGHENADCSSAGGRAETDASPAAPNTETTGPQPSAGEVEASPAPRLTDNQQAVLAVHKAHPKMTAADIARATGLGRGAVSNIVKTLGIEPAPYVSFAATLRAYAAENPTHTMEDCAAALDEPIAKVRNNAHANKIKFAPGRRGRKPSTEQRKPDPAPTPAPQAKPAPAVKSEPARPGSVIMHKAPVTPRGTRFYLRDDAGHYLHQSVQRRDGKPLMTTEKAYAWCDVESRLVAVRRVLPETMTFEVVPFVKDQPAARQYA